MKTEVEKAFLVMFASILTSIGMYLCGDPRQYLATFFLLFGTLHAFRALTLEDEK